MITNHIVNPPPIDPMQSTHDFMQITLGDLDELLTSLPEVQEVRFRKTGGLWRGDIETTDGKVFNVSHKSCAQVLTVLAARLMVMAGQ